MRFFGSLSSRYSRRVLSWVAGLSRIEKAEFRGFYECGFRMAVPYHVIFRCFGSVATLPGLLILPKNLIA